MAPFGKNKRQTSHSIGGKESRLLKKYSLKLVFFEKNTSIGCGHILLVSKYFEEKYQPIKKLVEGLLMHIVISTLCPS